MKTRSLFLSFSFLSVFALLFVGIYSPAWSREVHRMQGAPTVRGAAPVSRDYQRPIARDISPQKMERKVERKIERTWDGATNTGTSSRTLSNDQGESVTIDKTVTKNEDASGWESQTTVVGGDGRTYTRDMQFVWDKQSGAWIKNASVENVQPEAGQPRSGGDHLNR